MSTDLTPTDFQQLERLDEAQIISELQGAVLQDYVYTVKGKPALSWAGIKAVASKIGAIVIDLVNLTTTEENYLCVVKATAPDGSSRIGAAEQARVQDDGKPDPFALPKVVSKAQRNAIRALLPETLIAEVVRLHSDQAKSASAKTKAIPATTRPKGEATKSQPKVIDATTFWTLARELDVDQAAAKAIVQACKDASGKVDWALAVRTLEEEEE